MNRTTHKNVRVVYGEPQKVNVWSYLSKRKREMHVYIVSKQSEVIHVVVTVPR